jgi:hypothetical protein
MLFLPPSSSRHTLLLLRPLTSGLRYTPASVNINIEWRYQEIRTFDRKFLCLACDAVHIDRRNSLPPFSWYS